MAGQIKHVQEVEKNRHLNEKDVVFVGTSKEDSSTAGQGRLSVQVKRIAQLQAKGRLSAQVKRIAQLQARARFTLILGYDIQMYMLIVEDPTVNYVKQL